MKTPTIKNGQSKDAQTELMEMHDSVAPITKAYMESVADSKDQLPDAPKEPASLGDINFDVEQAQTRDYLNTQLSKRPPENWIQKHPMTGGAYISIATVEMLMRKIFQRFRTEVIDIKVIANAIAVHVRVHYVDPVTGEWDFQDGLGAVAIQVEKGSSATDFSKTRSDAIQKNLPAAESYAFKDACEKLGSLFGANLNRKDEIEFKPSYKKETQWTK